MDSVLLSLSLPLHHPVISLEAGLDLVLFPSGQCHLSRALPAILWLHHSTTIVIKIGYFCLGEQEGFFLSELWEEALQDTIKATLSNPYCCFFYSCTQFSGSMFTFCHLGAMGVSVPVS